MLTPSVGRLANIGFLLALYALVVLVRGEDHKQYLPPSHAEVSNAIDLADSYLERACNRDGQFVYLTNILSGKQSSSYNIVRHAGAIYALAMMQRGHPDKQRADAILRAASFLRQNYIGPGVRANQLVVWSKPLPQSSSADLGATGLGLVALTAVKQEIPDSVPLSQLKALGNFLVFMQRDDGSFVSKYSPKSGPNEDFESLYYPGEAALGLIDLYELDPSKIWLADATRALAYMAKSRAKLSDVPPDHWSLIATAKLLEEHPENVSTALRNQLVHHAMQICEALMKDQQRMPANQSLDGSFDPTGRTAPTATRVEGLLAALEFLPNGNLRTQVKDTVDYGIAFLLRTQFRDGVYAGALPNAKIAATPGAFYIRIDFVQHALCAWLQYEQMSNRGHPPRYAARVAPLAVPTNANFTELSLLHRNYYLHRSELKRYKD